MFGVYKDAAQHLSAVVTDSSGRGGSDNNNIVTGDLRVTVAPYVSGHSDHTENWEKKFPID
mgnify:CR=1 FL=1